MREVSKPDKLKNDPMPGADKGDRTKDASRPGTSSEGLDVTQLRLVENRKNSLDGRRTPESSEAGDPISLYRQRSGSGEERQHLLHENVPEQNVPEQNVPEQPGRVNRGQELVGRVGQFVSPSRLLEQRREKKYQREETRDRLITQVRKRLDQRAQEIIMENPDLERQVHKVAMRIEKKVWNLFEGKKEQYPRIVTWTVMGRVRSLDALLKRLVVERKVNNWLTVKRIVKFPSTIRKHRIMDQLVKPPKPREEGASTATHNDSGESAFTIKHWAMLDRMRKTLYQEVENIAQEKPEWKRIAEGEALRILRSIRYNSYWEYYNGEERGLERELIYRYSNKGPDLSMANRLRPETQRMLHERLEAALGNAPAATMRNEPGAGVARRSADDGGRSSVIQAQALPVDLLMTVRGVLVIQAILEGYILRGGPALQARPG